MLNFSISMKFEILGTKKCSWRKQMQFLRYIQELSNGNTEQKVKQHGTNSCNSSEIAHILVDQNYVSLQVHQARRICLKNLKPFKRRTIFLMAFLAKKMTFVCQEWVTTLAINWWSSSLLYSVIGNSNVICETQQNYIIRTNLTYHIKSL